MPTSRQRTTVASGRPIDDPEQPLATDEADTKYHKHRRPKQRGKPATPRQIILLLGLFTIVLVAYHVLVKVQRDKQRHTKQLYERAQSILHNMQQSNDQRRHRHPADDNEEDDRNQLDDDKSRHGSKKVGLGGAGGGHGASPGHHHPGGLDHFHSHSEKQHPHNHPHVDDDKRNHPDIATTTTTTTTTTHQVEDAFAAHRLVKGHPALPQILKDWVHQWDQDIVNNVHGGIRWIRPYLLPGMDDVQGDYAPPAGPHKGNQALFRAQRRGQRMQWWDEWKALVDQYGGAEKVPGPPVDYTDPDKYVYPALLEEPPVQGGYPQMTALGDMMAAWDQDEDHQGTIHETLLHFNFSDPRELAMAQKFRDAMLPFKLYNVPELTKANELWTDEYVSQGFGGGGGLFHIGGARAHGTAQESPNHYFAFFTVPQWRPERMGLPPTRNTDWDFADWAQHARYADATRLAADQPHFYWQSGADKSERYQPASDWSFISRDLPSFSATEPNFIMFNPEDQKGIQCRFGERGVVAATHYDSGRNMVGMITGAKRYILSPPNACGKLGIFPDRKSPIFRHSLLNFGHIKYLHDDEKGRGMSDEEREWLVRAATAPAVETVLKAGEVLYIPSFWFHYIISVQKSAQCNARSGIEYDSHREFGGYEDVKECPVE